MPNIKILNCKKNMKTHLFLLLSLIVVLSSCTDKEETEVNIETSFLTNKWWEVKCVDIDQSTAQTTMVGGLDYGKFYFKSDGTYTRTTESAQLEVCNPVDSNFPYVINSNSGSVYGSGGWGVPFGDINSYPNDSTWTINGNIITMSHWGSWRLIEEEDSRILIKSSRTNYYYEYTLVND